MASQIGVCPRAIVSIAYSTCSDPSLRPQPSVIFHLVSGNQRNRRFRVRVSDGGDSYLHMWKNAVYQEKKERAFRRIADDSETDPDDLEKKTEEFQKILNVPKEDRDRIQKMQVIDRAAAAISAARAILDNRNLQKKDGFADERSDAGEGTETASNFKRGTWSRTIYVPQSESSGTGTPGPDFWSWTPPQSSDGYPNENGDLLAAAEPTVFPAADNPVIEKQRSNEFLSIPFESKLSANRESFILPPFQSLVEAEEKAASEPSTETSSLNADRDLDILSSAHAAEAAHALDNQNTLSSYGVNPDGTKWWKQMGVEQRPDGVVCRWTMTRGVSSDGAVEWQDKYWEAADEFGYKELGSEKSGRDATGDVWREFWRESILQECGVMHIEKTADKWGRNGNGDEWQEKWWEHYDAAGKAEKWAHKWCSIDPNTQIDVGHAHVWHERWGEKYDGQGGSTKYTDKWAERCEGDRWDKWGDKWDEHFDPNGHGVKQGETWWEGKQGDRWNRTWGEGHNGSGWVHKYGKSSCGEHWGTHEQQETWYERFPHFGFYHCYDNSVQLRAVQKPSERNLESGN